MHIPDGYLSLQTTLPAIVVMIPFWTVALNKVKKVLSHKQIPLLSMCAAFSFVIMMFNVPIGQSSVHAVGAVFIAILLGPWAACISVSIALILQALVFGDGGVIAIGINCFNMAIVMPFAGYYIYKLIAGKSALLSKRSLLGIFTGSYIGINIAALFTAIEFGIQPLLFKAADGNPLFGYYPLSVSIPTMMAEHTLLAGPIEGIITVAAITYLAKSAPHLLVIGDKFQPDIEGSVLKRYKSFIIGLIVLVVLTPLGLIATGTAWGEWSMTELQKKIGYIPQGFAKISHIWTSIMPDYTAPGLGGGFFQSALGYIISAIVGIALISTVMLITFKILMKEQKSKGKDKD